MSSVDLRSTAGDVPLEQASMNSTGCQAMQPSFALAERKLISPWPRPIHPARTHAHQPPKQPAMALSVSSLASAFSHLSLPSTSAPHPPPLLLRLLPSPHRAARLALSASAADAAEPVEAEAPAVDEVLAVEAEAEEDALSGFALRKYVKQRLPGGFAAQRITATGRRKTASARVVLQEGTGKVFINFRDAKVLISCLDLINARPDFNTVAAFCAPNADVAMWRMALEFAIRRNVGRGFC